MLHPPCSLIQHLPLPPLARHSTSTHLLTPGAGYGVQLTRDGRLMKAHGGHGSPSLDNMQLIMMRHA
jgi:hypothetical protein